MAAASAASPARATRRMVLFALWTALGLIASLAISLTLAGIPARYRELNPVLPQEARQITASFLLVVEVGLAVFFFGVALFIALKRPHDPIALFLALTLVLLGAVETSMTDALINPQWSSVADTWHWPVLILRAVEMICALTLLYIFPDGRFTPPWTRPLAVIWCVANLAWLLFPNLPFNTIYGPTWRATPLASLLVGIGWFGSGIAALVLRYLKSSDVIQRQQTWWIAAGMLAATLGGLLYYGISAFVDSGLLPQYHWYLESRIVLQALGMGLLPVCLAVAVLRYRLFDLDLVINRVLVHGVLTIIVIMFYIGLVTAFNTLFQATNDLFGALLATGLVAVGFQPLRTRLQQVVDRLMYGVRDDPYTIIAHLGQQLDAPRSPAQLLALIAETVAKALKLPYVSIEQSRAAPAETAQVDAPLVATFGTRPAKASQLRAFGMNYRGETIGQLIVALRSGEQRFRQDEQQLLGELARQTGFVLHTIVLNAEILRSRQRLVITREDERLRMRRDLHDGMGPTLASITQRIGLVAALIPNDPVRSIALLGEIETQVRAVIGDIRHLVYALRPPMLDQYGLVGALRLEIERIVADVCIVEISAAELPVLPPALEIAAYRIVLEAVTNVVRHAAAQYCWVTLLLQPGGARDTSDTSAALWLHIQDNGCGMVLRNTTGVGLHSMRERAEEIGGGLDIVTKPGHGTTISAWLPIGNTVVVQGG